MNYYNFHIGDYRRDTTHLSMLEHGAYRQLIDWLYLDEKPIPRETEVVFRRLSARTEEEQKAIEIVLSEMFELTEEGYVQGRCMVEIEAYKGKAERARQAGKLGGRPKKTEEVISGLSEITEEKANHKPITNNQEPIVKTLRPVVADIFPHIADRQLVEDWVKVRKTKKAPVTQTALDGFVREVEKSGLSLEDALRKCCEQSWAGFKASWLTAQPEKCSVLHITEEMEEWAISIGLPEERVRTETQRFFFDHKAKGSEFVDWNSAWKARMVAVSGYAGTRQ